jgi:hypothetical protein
MAFDITYMAKVSSSGNTEALNVWTYNGTSTGANDTVAEIATAGYFNDFMQNLTTGNGPLQIGDTIFVSGSDANGMYKVTDVTTNVEVGAFAAAGTIDTANLANSAVTADKLASNAVTTAKILDANVTSAKLAANLVRYSRVSVSLANFIASNTTPVEILAAPGATSKYIVHRASLTVDYGGTVLAAGGTVQFTYGATAGVAGAIATNTLAAATIIAATADTMFGFEPVETTLLDSLTLNAPISLSTETADFTGGTGSTYEVDIWYSVVPV